MDTLERDCVEAIRANAGYDFIADNYHLMSKEQLKRVCMECLYEIHRHGYDRQEYLNNIADELGDFWP